MVRIKNQRFHARKKCGFRLAHPPMVTCFPAEFRKAAQFSNLTRTYALLYIER